MANVAKTSTVDDLKRSIMPRRSLSLLINTQPCWTVRRRRP
ncbi:rCG37143 [Rattus norvegicus]|uniref:RCG37143 n=1 Tax=Rattus norvegicus TaxID=10116 RepID=A6HU18_RAT|nr:rCG37143 [Rattus norvegicus]